MAARRRPQGAAAIWLKKLYKFTRDEPFTHAELPSFLQDVGMLRRAVGRGFIRKYENLGGGHYIWIIADIDNNIKLYEE